MDLQKYLYILKQNLHFTLWLEGKINYDLRLRLLK